MIGPSRNRAPRDEDKGTRRNYWGCARERNRRLARTAIKKRIDNTEKCEGPETTPQHSDASKEWIQNVLWNTIKGKRAFFSLTCIQDNILDFETPHSTKYMFASGDVDEEMIGKAQMYNWFGKDGYEVFKDLIRSEVETFTFYEYAVWCRRWHVVTGFLIAGVNPCIRGRRRLDSADLTNEQYDTNSAALLQMGQGILKLFFDKGVPLSLSGYLVNEVVERRRSARIACCMSCAIIDPLIYCDLPHCRGLCELCWWRNVVKDLDELEDRLGCCPLCFQQCVSGSAETATTSSLAALRYGSLQRYTDLPENTKQLKEFAADSLPMNQLGPTKVEELTPAWSSAVAQAAGSTKDIRRDRYFINVSKGRYHHVKGILSHGMDVNLQNEYGQTGLYIAAWLGYVAIVGLLLEYGADPDIPANGGSTAWDAAKASDCGDALTLLAVHGAVHSNTELNEGFRSGRPSLTTLIDLSVDHPGAGSFYIDDALDDFTIESLVRLRRSISIEETCIKVKKDSKCSDRSYYCDAVGSIRKALHGVICSAFGSKIDTLTLVVLEHMRFLSYVESGMILPPHTDLSRVDRISGEHSTHTFILYLTDCLTGGETALLEHTHGEGRHKVLAKVKPSRGRLLLFPHLTPHEGEEVKDVPKLLLRGEVVLEFA